MLNKKTELSFKMQRRCTCKGYLLSSLATCQTTTELLSRTSMLVPTDVIPTKLYHQRKTGKGTSNVMCRMCGKSPESVRHVLAGCGTLISGVT